MRARLLNFAVAAIGILSAAQVHAEPYRIAPFFSHVGLSRPETVLFYEDYIFLKQVGQTLIDLGPHAEVRPSVASTWRISKDRLTYTFDIRNDLKFHDGSNLTVDDVIYSLNSSIYDERNPSHYYFERVKGYDIGRIKKSCPGIIAGPSQNQLTIILDSPYAPLMPTLSLGNLIVRPRNPKNNAFLIASGPYKIDEVLDGKVRLSSFRDYRGAYPPHIPSIELIADDKLFRVNAPYNEAALPDYDYDVTKARRSVLSEHGYEVTESPRLASSAFYLNPRKSNFLDENKRLSTLKMLSDISHLVNIETKSGFESHDLFPRGMLGHKEDRSSFAEFMKKLSNAKVEQRKKLSIALPSALPTAEIFQRLARERYNVEISFHVIGFKDMSRSMGTFQEDVFYLRWICLFLDPEASFTPFRLFHLVPTSDQNFNRLQAMADADPLLERRSDLYGKMADILIAKAVFLPIWQWHRTEALRKGYRLPQSSYRYSPMFSEIDKVAN